MSEEFLVNEGTNPEYSLYAAWNKEDGITTQGFFSENFYPEETHRILDTGRYSIKEGDIKEWDLLLPYVFLQGEPSD